MNRLTSRTQLRAVEMLNVAALLVLLVGVTDGEIFIFSTFVGLKLNYFGAMFIYLG